MYRYFATFPAGTQEIVTGILRERLSDLRLSAVLDGGIAFETAVPYSDLNLFCFQNLFQVLHSGPAPQGEDPLGQYCKALPRSQADWAPVKSHPAKAKTFRVVASSKNRLVSVAPSSRAALEKRIAGLSGLRVDRSRPDLEFWVLYRSEGTCWFLKRLSRHKSYEKLLDPGELHPELAYLMCWLSCPSHTDVVLDPFCGYGAIPAQRCKRFPYAKMLAFDLDKAVLRRAGEKLSVSRDKLRLEAHDVLRLDSVLEIESVDAVITDPPWGLYRDVGMDLVSFYRQALAQLFRVLKPGGRLVLLTAKKEEFGQALAEAGGFSLVKTYHILVSGKKAGLYCLEKPVARDAVF